MDDDRDPNGGSYADPEDGDGDDAPGRQELREDGPRRSGFDPAPYMRQLRGRGGGGQDYLDVKWRLLWLRREHPDAEIVTEHVRIEEASAVFKATVTLPAGGKATGYGSETVGDFGDFIEKAETKAIGRALNALGYGAQFAEDGDLPPSNALPPATGPASAPRPIPAAGYGAPLGGSLSRPLPAAARPAGHADPAEVAAPEVAAPEVAAPEPGARRPAPSGDQGGARAVAPPVLPPVDLDAERGRAGRTGRADEGVGQDAAAEGKARPAPAAAIREEPDPVALPPDATPDDLVRAIPGLSRGVAGGARSRPDAAPPREDPAADPASNRREAVAEPEPELADYSHTAFWDWARGEGLETQDAVEALIGRPMKGLTPAAVRKLIRETRDGE